MSSLVYAESTYSILDIDWFADRRVSEVGMFSIQKLAYIPFELMEKNE